jgi:hypothetical protein
MLANNIGDRVSYEPEDEPIVTGMLARYNSKTAIVIADSGNRWNVAPCLLRQTQNAPAQTEVTNVVSVHKR